MPRIASLPIFLERNAGRTLQEQIYSSIRQCIVDGRVAVDQRLPSTRALAAELGVSRNTALLALEQLRAEGYLVARRGSGVFISRDVPERRRTALLGTLFRFAQLFGWIEILYGTYDRLRFEHDVSTKSVADAVREIGWLLADDRVDRTDEPDAPVAQEEHEEGRQGLPRCSDGLHCLA